MITELQSAFARMRDLAEDDSNEDDVERLFQPVYEALGFRQPGHDIRGKRRGESGAPDVALLNSDRSFQVIFELKRPSESLKVHRKQLFGYVIELKAPWGVLSNGRDFELYRRNGLAVILEKPLKIEDLASDPSALKVLAKQHFALQDFSVVETRISAAGRDSLQLITLENIASRIFLEPIREVIESNESDVIPWRALDSHRSARCGHPNTAAWPSGTAYVTRAI